MNLLDDTLGNFGRSMGIENLALRENGVLLLNIEKIGMLAIELVGERHEEVSISLIRRIETPDSQACQRLLESCHYRSPAPFPTRVGLTGQGELLFAIRMDIRQFTLPAIHQALDWLISLHDQNSSSVRYA